MLVTSVEGIAQIEKQCPLIVSVRPYLHKCYGEERAKNQATDLNSMQWQLIVTGNDADSTV